MRKDYRTGFHRGRNAAQPGDILIHRSSCDGCGVCVATCPNDVFMVREMTSGELSSLSFMGRIKVRFKGRNKSYVLDAARCTFCGLCEINCHEHAIAVGAKP
ncbi:MAG: 4Fe-4S dicluster domain-containing protein [Spirochaetes bacterium]|nr:4Fe-4S dicluster domain-containing protein [Spirochaetota bacterium]